MVGMGVAAAGTSLLVLLAKRVDDRRRAAAATIMWILMIAGFAVTSGVVGHFLDPFSPQRLIQVTGIAAAAAFLIALAAVWGVEGPGRGSAAQAAPARPRSQQFIRRRPRSGLARSADPALHLVRVRFDARLQRPGVAARAIQRAGIRLHPGGVGQTIRFLAWCGAGRDDRCWFALQRPPSFRLAAAVAHRRLLRIRRRALVPGRCQPGRPGLAAAPFGAGARCVERRVSPCRPSGR